MRSGRTPGRRPLLAPLARSCTATPPPQPGFLFRACAEISNNQAGQSDTVHMRGANHSEARASCQAAGGELATIPSEDEASCISKYSWPIGGWIGLATRCAGDARRRGLIACMGVCAPSRRPTTCQSRRERTLLLTRTHTPLACARPRPHGTQRQQAVHRPVGLCLAVHRAAALRIWLRQLGRQRPARQP